MNSSRKERHMFQLVLWLALIHSTNWKGKVEADYPTLKYSISATWLDDPEPNWTVAFNEARWETFTKEAENLGLTFAGKNEFPWIVDIRVDKKTLEYWAVGNLIRQNTVFTTCRAVEDLGDFKYGINTPRVTFAQMYLWEYTQREDQTSQEWLYGGSRTILEAKVHKKCSAASTYYDGALVILTAPIIPAPPSINTITITIDLNSGIVPDFDLEKMGEQRRICYVASIGRDYINIKDHIVKDFKVKYRVYIERNEFCDEYRDRMCPNRYMCPSDCRIAHLDPNADGKELMCFKSRAKVGAVCDHDKGAPLVCDGQVFGLVILGAKQDYCNDLLALPFWVQKVSVFEDWFHPTVKLYDIDKNISPTGSAESFINRNNILQRFLPILFPLFHFFIQN